MAIQPQIINDYKILETLGQGTFGKVKLAIYTPTKQKYAIKILKKSKLVGKDDVNRLIRELEIIKSFNNENIAKVFEVNYYLKFITI